MKKTTLIANLKYITLGLIVASALGFAHADFAAPTASAPAGNIDVPLHAGPDQVKNGDLSVNTFQASQNAQFKQQTFLNGTIFGGSPLSTNPSSTVTIGDAQAPANILVNGKLSAATSITSASVANTDSSTLCATANGTIVTCGKTVVVNTPPSLTQVGPTVTTNVSLQTFQVGSSIEPGDTFSLGVYNYEVKVTAVAGDDVSTIVEKLVAAINSTTEAEWRSGAPNNSGGVPDGTPGFLPIAQSSGNNSSWIITTVDSGHQFGSSAEGQ